MTWGALQSAALTWLLAGAFSASWWCVGVEAATYSFAEGHTTIIISWDHAGLSRNSARIVGVDGTLAFEPSRPETSSLEVKLDPSRLSSGVPALDRLLRSVDFFDAAASPAVTFKSTGIVVTGERTGEVTGDLTIKAIARPVTLNVTWNFAGEHPLGLVNPSFSGKFVAGFSAHARIRRSDWGLERGAPLISDEVQIVIETEVVRR